MAHLDTDDRYGAHQRAYRDVDHDIRVADKRLIVIHEDQHRREDRSTVELEHCRGTIGARGGKRRRAGRGRGRGRVGVRVMVRAAAQ